MKKGIYIVAKLYMKMMVYCLGLFACLAGCGQPGQGAFSPEKEPSKEQTLILSEQSFFSLERAPLLAVGDVGEENLAGLLQQEAGGVMVQLEVEGREGSGVLWQQEGDLLYMVTAAHVIMEDTATVQVRFWDGWETEAKNIYICENADLAFLCVDIGNVTQEQAALYKLASVDREKYDRMQKGDRILLMASVRGVAGDAYEGELLDPWIYIEDFQQYMMYLKAPAYPGMSGGGIFDSEGYLVGIFCASAWQEGETAGEMSEGVAVPLAIMLTEFERITP